MYELTNWSIFYERVAYSQKSYWKDILIALLIGNKVHPLLNMIIVKITHNKPVLTKAFSKTTEPSFNAKPRWLNTFTVWSCETCLAETKVMQKALIPIVRIRTVPTVRVNTKATIQAWTSVTRVRNWKWELEINEARPLNQIPCAISYLSWQNSIT